MAAASGRFVAANCQTTLQIEFIDQAGRSPEDDFPVANVMDSMEHSLTTSCTSILLKL